MSGRDVLHFVGIVAALATIFLSILLIAGNL